MFDVYIFPYTSQDASTELSMGYISALISDGVLSTNMVWMDIEVHNLVFFLF
jgi:hypothetical protein